MATQTKLNLTMHKEQRLLGEIAFFQDQASHYEIGSLAWNEFMDLAVEAYEALAAHQAQFRIASVATPQTA